MFGMLYFIITIFYPAYSFNINLSKRIGSFLGLKGSSNICMKMKKDSRIQYYCYETLIDSVKSVNGCNQIKDFYGMNGNWKEVCYRSLARRLKDATVCQESQDNENIKSLCYEEVAEASLDANLCELATDSIRKGNCYYILAQKLNKLDLCYKAEEYKNNCLTEFAYKLRDATLCKSVDNNVNYYYEETPKDRCLRYSQGEKDPVMIY